jgi:hypothetical protein
MNDAAGRRWAPMDDDAGHEHLQDIAGRICTEHPLHAEHFIERIVLRTDHYSVTCRCGVTFRLEAD